MHDKPHWISSEQPFGFQKTVGFELVEWREGYAVLELEVETKHLNRSGVLHGGVLTTMLDSVMGFAGLYSPDPNRIRKAVTLSMSTSFTGQVRAGRIRAVGQLRTSGRRIFNCTGEVLDAEGNVLGMAQGTFRLRSDSVD